MAYPKTGLSLYLSRQASSLPRYLALRHVASIAILLAGAALALRLVALDAWSLWADEVASLILAAAPVPVILPRAVELHPPLYYLFLHVWQTWGSGETWYRLPSALAGVLAVPCVAWAARQLPLQDPSGGEATTDCVDPRGLPAAPPVAALLAAAPLVAAVLMALSPLHIWYSREVRMYAPAALFATAATACYLGLLQDKALHASHASSLSRLRHPNACAVAYVLFAWLAIYTAYAALFLWLVGMLVAPILARRLYAAPAPARRFWWAQLAVALGFAPYLPVVAAQVRYGNFGFLADRLASANLSPAILAALLVLAALTLTILARLRRSSAPASIVHLQSSISNLQSPIVIVALFVALTVLAALPRGLSIKRQLLVFWPVAVIVAAAALVSLRRPALTAATLVLSLGLSVAMLAGGPFEDWRAAARYVTSSGPHDPVYLQSISTRDAFAHYYRGDAPLYVPDLQPATGVKPGFTQPATGSAWLVINDHPALHREALALHEGLAAATVGPARSFSRYLSVAAVSYRDD